MPAPWVVDTPASDAPVAPGLVHPMAGCQSPHLIPEGQRLLARASSLAGVRLGGRGIPRFDGTPLRYGTGETRPKPRHGYIQGRIFAAVANDGSMCLRLPAAVAEDLAENGLCVQVGRNQLTWPITSAHQREIAWRILLHAYWEIAGTPPKHARRLWSEWVINH